MNLTDADKNSSRPKTILVKIFFVVMSTLLAFAGVEIAVRLIAPCPIPGYHFNSPQKRFFEYDAELGWRGRPGAKGEFRSFDFDVSVVLDNAGFRNANPPYIEGKQNVIVIGDSFGWGWGVSNDQLFSQIMMHIDKSLNVYNLSAPGYGTDQELLVLHEFLAANPDKQFDSVVLLFYPGNDYEDVAASVRYSYPKPVFENDDGALRVTNVPVLEKAGVFETNESEQSDTFGSVMDRVFRISHVYNRIVERRRVLARKEARTDLQIRSPNPSAVELAHKLVEAIGDEAATRSAKFSVIVITREWNSIEQENAEYLLAFLKEAGIAHARFDFGISCSLCVDSHINAKGQDRLASLAIRLLDDALP